MQYRFIAIEGNIGAGKTTLASLLQNHYQGRLILEEFTDNPFLTKFYENPGQHAFPMELFFMAKRYKQMKELISVKDLFNTVTIADYLFTKSLLFAKVNLLPEEFKLFQQLFDIIQPQVIQPDILIYLHAPVQKLLKNIHERKRTYEQQIEDSYLINIQDAYHQYIKQHKIKTLLVDATQADFTNNPEHLKAITDALEKDYENGQHIILLP